jgi:uncharacterized protein YaaQ
MKMVLAIVQADDVNPISDALVNAGHRVTRIATTGVWLRRENATLLMGVEDGQVDEVLGILRKTGQRRSVMMSMPMDTNGVMNAEVFNVEIGGAIVFVLNVTQFAHY